RDASAALRRRDALKDARREGLHHSRSLLASRAEPTAATGTAALRLPAKSASMPSAHHRRDPLPARHLVSGDGLGREADEGTELAQVVAQPLADVHGGGWLGHCFPPCVCESRAGAGRDGGPNTDAYADPQNDEGAAPPGAAPQDPGSSTW